MSRLKGDNTPSTHSRSSYIETLRFIYDYDPATGNLINIRDQTPMGRRDANGALIATVMGEQHTVAKFVWMHQYGYMPIGQVRLHDPEQGTRIENLYDTQGKQNGIRSARYKVHTQIDPETGEKINKAVHVPQSNERGVTWQTGRDSWRVIVRGKYLGNYKDLDKAVKARDKELKRLMDEKGTNASHRRWQGLDPINGATPQPSKSITVPYLESLFFYDEGTGFLYERNPQRRGQPFALSDGEMIRVGGDNPPYDRPVMTQLLGKQYQVAQIVFMLHNGYMPDRVIYLDGNKHNYSIENISDMESDMAGHPYAFVSTSGNH